MRFEKQLLDILDVVERRNYYPTICEIQAIEGAGESVVIDGKCYDNYSSNSYLGISRDPRVITSAKNALDRYGIGSGGSRLTSGTHTLHRELEEKIAEFKGAEDAVLFSSGYLMNIGVLCALLNSPIERIAHELDPSMNGQGTTTHAFFDELVHASIIDGMMLASTRLFGGKVRMHKYLHLDVDHLEQELDDIKPERALVITDGVFSLHGRIAPLAKIVPVAKRYGASIYVDDAHGTAVLGPNGHGTAELCGVEGAIDFPVGTLSKALGGEGGFLAGTKKICAYLRVACRTHMFQTSLSPAVVAGLITAIDIAQNEPERRVRLCASSAHVRTELTRLGFDIFGSKTQIIPVCFRTESQAKKACEILMEEGVFAPPYYYPAVRHDEAMIRVNIMATHNDEQLEKLVSALDRAGKETSIL